MNSKEYRLSGLYLFPYYNGEEIEYKIMWSRSSNYIYINENIDRYIDTYAVVSNGKLVTSDYEYCSLPGKNPTTICYYNEDVQYNLHKPANRRLYSFIKGKEVYTQEEIEKLETTINANKEAYIPVEQLEEDIKHYADLNIKKLLLSGINK